MSEASYLSPNRSNALPKRVLMISEISFSFLGVFLFFTPKIARFPLGALFFALFFEDADKLKNLFFSMNLLLLV